MMSRTHISIIAGLVLSFSLLGLWIRGTDPTPGAMLAVFGGVVSAVYIVVLLFSSFGWSLPFFRRWLVKCPDLRGTWSAKLRSDYRDESGASPGEIEAYVVIRQTLTTLSMRLFTEKSRSMLIAHAIEAESDGLFALAAVYRNHPKIELQATKGRPAESAIHHGSLLIDPHEYKPTTLQGHYWTDRGTRGTLVLSLCSATYFDTFEAAREGCVRSS